MSLKGILLLSQTDDYTPLVAVLFMASMKNLLGQSCQVQVAGFGRLAQLVRCWRFKR